MRRTLLIISWSFISALPLEYFSFFIAQTVASAASGTPLFACRGLSGVLFSCPLGSFLADDLLFIILANVALLGLPTLIAIGVLYLGLTFAYRARKDAPI